MSLQSVNATNFDTLGFVAVTWDQTGKSAGFEAWRVYRRDVEGVTPSAWTLLHQSSDGVSPTITYEDFLPPANRAAEYAVVEVTTGNVEGPYTDSQVVTPESTHYWLIAAIDSDLNFRLEHVTKDDFSDQYEEETIPLIGRGRKKEVGTRWGFAGKLTASMRNKNNKTGAEQRIELEAFKLRQGEGSTYMRTPFGDVVKTSIGELNWTRLSGSGSSAWYEVSFPYEEIY